MYQGCQYGAAKKRPHTANPTGGVTGEGLIEQPGDFVTVDQLESGSPPGLMPFTIGNISKCRYKLCTLRVDHFSHYLLGHLQEDKGEKAILESKIKFEKLAKQYGCTIQHIHGDNGVF